MTARNIFINANFQLRAGWRILIFIAIMFVLLAVVGIVLKLVFPQWAVLATVKEAVAVALVALSGAFAAWIMLKWIDKRPFTALGLRPAAAQFRELGWGLLTGFTMLSVTVGTMWVLGWEDVGMAPQDMGYFLEGLAVNLFLYILVGFNEEILFRGYVFQSLIEGIGPILATVLFSVLFGAAHMGNPNVSMLGIINVILAGILLSVAYLRTRALWLPIGIHIAWNFTQGYVWGLPVSGTTQVMPLTISQETGPDLLTGGTFGPEGGLMVSLVCVLATVAVWWFFRPSEAMTQIVDGALAVQPFKPKDAGLPTPVSPEPPQG